MRTLPICLLFVLGSCTSTATRPAAQVSSSTPITQVLPLAYASADELSGTLSSLFARNPEIRVMCDHRTNSLLIMGSPEDVKRIEELVRRIDVEVKPAH